MNAPAILAFDPESPDAVILDAFEKVRAHRAYSYGFDHLLESDPAEFERITDAMEPLDAEQVVNERMVHDNWATTPSGVAAQLILSISEGGCDRDVDRMMAQSGARALYVNRETLALDGRERRVIKAAYELLHIEWEHALAEYERAHADFEAILQLKDVVESLHFNGAPGLGQVTSLIYDLENRFCDAQAFNKLVRTLAPDWTAYRRKAALAIREQFATEAAPWLLRDANFLIAQIEPEQVAV